MTESLRGPNSYLDFSGLAELRGEARADGRAAIRRTAQQFEAMFVQMMLRAMREAQGGSDLIESNALDTYRSMHDKELSMLMARRGVLGIADMLTRQLDKVTATTAVATTATSAAGDPESRAPEIGRAHV